MCGIGVTSRIDLTSVPIVCSARIADSRPAPGPLTLTSTLRMPNALAALPAEIAACVAAAVRSVAVTAAAALYLAFQ